MHKRSKTKKRSMHGWIVGLSILVATAYLVIYFIEGQMQIATLEQELGQVEQELSDLSVRNEELSGMMQADNQDMYVERVAREEMDYVRPNDRVFVDISSD